MKELFASGEMYFFVFTSIVCLLIVVCFVDCLCSLSGGGSKWSRRTVTVRPGDNFSSSSWTVLIFSSLPLRLFVIVGESFLVPKDGTSSLPCTSESLVSIFGSSFSSISSSLNSTVSLSTIGGGINGNKSSVYVVLSVTSLFVSFSATTLFSSTITIFKVSSPSSLSEEDFLSNIASSNWRSVSSITGTLSL